MDIRTKLIFALVVVALVSMIAMGAAVSSEVEGFMRDSRLDRLDEAAESRSQALLWIIEGWHERTDLIASRTQLRASLDEFAGSADTGAAARLGTILDDAIDSSGSVRLVEIYDVSGALVASVGKGPALERSDALGGAPTSPSRTEYVGVDFEEGSVPRVTFSTPMEWNGRAIGTLVAVFDAQELLELTGSYRGLGETGETLVFAAGKDGSLRTLHPPRHAPDGGGGVTLRPGTEGIAGEALTALDEPPTDRLTDYRGEAVWSAARLVEETGWGLVVKIDASEVERPYGEFRAWLRRTALILAAFAILAGFGLGMRFALPIHDLSEAANRIRGGDMRARAKVTVEDEVGVLARTFNEMADELEEQMTLLHEFRKFFDVSIDLMCMAGVDGYFKRVNPAFVRVLGWSKEELCSRPFYDFVHPEDIAKTQEEVAKLARGIPTISFENRFQCQDGTYRLLRWTSYPEEGRLYAIAHVVDSTSA